MGSGLGPIIISPELSHFLLASLDDQCSSEYGICRRQLLRWFPMMLPCTDAGCVQPTEHSKKDVISLLGLGYKRLWTCILVRQCVCLFLRSLALAEPTAMFVSSTMRMPTWEETGPLPTTTWVSCSLMKNSQKESPG